MGRREEGEEGWVPRGTKCLETRHVGSSTGLSHLFREQGARGHAAPGVETHPGICPPGAPRVMRMMADV